MLHYMCLVYYIVYKILSRPYNEGIFLPFSGCWYVKVYIVTKCGAPGYNWADWTEWIGAR